MTSAPRVWVRIELEPRNYDGFPPYPHVLFNIDLLFPDEQGEGDYIIVELNFVEWFSQ